MMHIKAVGHFIAREELYPTIGTFASIGD